MSTEPALTADDLAYVKATVDRQVDYCKRHHVDPDQVIVALLVGPVQRLVADVSNLEASLADVVRARNYAMRQRDEERAAKSGNIEHLSAALARVAELEELLDDAGVSR